MTEMENHASTAPRVLILGSLSALLCALATYYYFVSVILYPFWFGLFFVARRAYKRSATPKSLGELIGLSLGVGALVMPVTGVVSFVIYNALDIGVHPNGTIETGWAFFRVVYTPVLIAFLASILVSMHVLRDRSRSGGLGAA